MRNEEKISLEVTAPSVEEALDKGLAELGLTENDVTMEIVDEGKRNFFRFASKPATIILTVRDGIKPVYPAELKIPVPSTSAQFLADEDRANANFYFLADEERREEISSSFEDRTEDIQSLVEEVLGNILSQMGVKAKTQAETRLEDEGDKNVISVNIIGEDLSFLIGRRSETLNALQYLVSLIISKKMGRWVPIQLDIQNYRARRESEIRKLAYRLAEQAVSTGRKQFLEPMPANERRIVHIALRADERVQTESIGEEPNRKVGIVPIK